MVDLDLAALVDLEAGGLQREPVGVGPAADGDQHDVRFDDLGLAALGRFDRYDDAVALVLDTVTLVPVRRSKPCFLKIFADSLRTSPSMPGRIWSRYSTTVTLAPRRFQTEPSSSPMTPPPITTRCFGTCASSSAPVESTTRCWSISTPGSGVTDEPVAMTMFFAV
jgi:hypothetical protein